MSPAGVVSPAVEASDAEPPQSGAELAAPRVIQTPAPGPRRALTEAWRQRSAFAYFTRRFLRKRYARTFLGMLWIPLRPLLGLATRALVFGGILGVTTGRVPYFLYFVIASGAWNLFSETAYFATRSLELSRSELRRVYVPRLIPLTASITMSVLSLAIHLLIAAGAIGYYLITRGHSYLVLRPETLLAPCGFGLLILMGLGIGLWTAPVGARARDIRWMTAYLLGVWYFFTPVIYPVERIPESWRFLASFNPITAPVELVKAGLIDAGHVTLTALAVTIGTLVVLIGTGLGYFNSKERKDLDYI